jgi:hypothetical protein
VTFHPGLLIRAYRLRGCFTIIQMGGATTTIRNATGFRVGQRADFGSIVSSVFTWNVRNFAYVAEPVIFTLDDVRK